MLSENTVFGQKIIDFYADKGVECSIVDEHLSLLITLSAEGRMHEFRYGKRGPDEIHHVKKFYLGLEKELSKLKASSAWPSASENKRTKNKYRDQVEEEEESLSLY